MRTGELNRAVEQGRGTEDTHIFSSPSHYDGLIVYNVICINGFFYENSDSYKCRDKLIKYGKNENDT